MTNGEFTIYRSPPALPPPHTYAHRSGSPHTYHSPSRWSKDPDPGWTAPAARTAGGTGASSFPGQSGEVFFGIYVDVIVSFRNDGVMLPRQITWEDGHKYEIDRVSDIRPAAAARAGGQGDRYTVWINGQQSYLFFERNCSLTGNNIGRWFVERKVA